MILDELLRRHFLLPGVFLNHLSCKGSPLLKISTAEWCMPLRRTAPDAEAMTIGTPHVLCTNVSDGHRHADGLCAVRPWACPRSWMYLHDCSSLELLKAVY